MMIRLGTYPTVLGTLDEGDRRLWIKRDDQVASLYGGNKVRKLEHLLGDAVGEGKTKIITIGAAGSHQVVATALYGRQEGFTVEAVLVPQVASEHARKNLRAAIALGLTPIVASSWSAAPAKLALHLARAPRETYLVPLGGSNALGSLGFVDAAREIAAQVRAGELPEPDAVVVAMGSGGTAAGLAVGFEALAMKTRVIGVVVSPPVSMVGAMAHHLAKTTAKLAGLSPAQAARAAARIEVDKRWVGKGYAYPTPAGDAATRDAKSGAGITLDPTYTAKAFACALDRVRAASTTTTTLYWHTLSSASMDALLADAPPLSPDVDALFQQK